MSNYSLQLEPTVNNVLESLKNNTLGTNGWIKKCLNVLLRMDNSVIAFDANWGNGKTFLAKQLQLIINEKWELNSGQKDNSEFDDFNGLDFKNIINNSCYAIYYNAWEYDNDNNPISSFLYYLLKMLKINFQSNDFERVATNFVINVIEKISCGFVKLSNDGKSNKLEDALESVIETEYVREEINNLLIELMAEKSDNLIIFIDELDRCRPTYALKIIEMIKHYLKMDNILVICMTDLKQIVNCIRSVYGEDYDANMYMDKIFDFRFTLPINHVDKKKYINTKISNLLSNNSVFDKICLEAIDYFNMSLRNIDKYLGYIKALIKRNKLVPNYNFTVEAFVLFLFAPYYIGLILFKPNLIDRIMNFDFEDYFSFCKKEKVFQVVKNIYRRSLENNGYEELKLFDYLKHDCELLIRQIKGEKYLEERYYVNNGSFNEGVEDIVEEIDILNFFSESNDIVKV